MIEGLKHFTLEEAAGLLETVDGNFIKGALIDPSGEKNAQGKLLMLSGAHDKDIAEMSIDEANQILRSHIHGITDIQLALLSYVNDNTAQKSSGFFTSRVVDVLRRPERFLGSNSPEILTLDRLIHTYTEEQIIQIPQVEWQSWDMRVAESAALYCATTASHNEAGDFGYAHENLGHGIFGQERLAAVLDAWNRFDPAIERFGYRSVHTNAWSWNMARLAARESAKFLDANSQRIYVNAVSEIQGYAIYGTLKPTKEKPEQPDHNPVFIGMLPGPDDQPLSFESLRKLTKAEK